MDPRLKAINSLDDLQEFYRNKNIVLEIIDDFEGTASNISSSVKHGKKSTGTYYTPHLFASFLVKKTLSSYLINLVNTEFNANFTLMEDLLATPDLLQLDYLENKLKSLKILDYSSGSGIFLLEALNFLLATFESIQQRRKILDQDDREINRFKLRRHFLLHCIHGVDTDHEAIEICKLKLKATFLDDCPSLDFQNGNAFLLPDLDFNIFYGNSLVGFDGKEELNHLEGNNPPLNTRGEFFIKLSAMITDYKTERGATDTLLKESILELINECSTGLNNNYLKHLSVNRSLNTEKVMDRSFHWLFFPAMVNGGFDIITGNPPYSAKISLNERELLSYLPVKSNFQSANLFIYKTFRLLCDKGSFFGLVVPKSLCHASNWAATRKMLIPRLEQVIDVQKAFPGVLLEEILVIGKKQGSSEDAILSSAMHGNQKVMEKPVTIPRHLLLAHNKIYLELDPVEVAILEKVTLQDQHLGDLCSIQRGFPWQRLVKTETTKGRVVLEGKNIRRNHVKRSFLSIPEEELEKLVTDQSIRKKVDKLSKRKILIQNIVAHISKPIPFIELCAVVDDHPYLNLDTVDNLFISVNPPAGVDYHSVAAFLNSSFASWFAYRFIYSKAIRTMHFDNIQLSVLPFRYVTGQENDKEIEDAIGDIRTGSLDLFEIYSELVALLEKLDQLTENMRVSSCLKILSLLGELSREMIQEQHSNWEKILDELSTRLTVNKKRIHALMKIHFNSKDKIIQKLEKHREIRTHYNQLDFKQQETIEKTIGNYFEELEKTREISKKFQLLIDEVIFRFFSLNREEINEIKQNHVLRTNL